MNKEVAWVASGQILTSVGIIISLRIMTDLLPPVAYGELALLLTICALVTQVLLGGVNAGASRYFAEALELRQTENYLNMLVKYSDRVILASIIMILSAIFLSKFFRGADIVEWVFALGYALITGVNSIINGVINSMRQRKVSALHQAGEVWLRIPILFILIYFNQNDLIKILMVYVVVSLAIAISQRYFLLSFIISMPGNQLLSELWEHKIIKYAIPYIPWTFLIWFQQVSDRWALDFYIGPQAVGIYAVTFQLGFSSILMLFSVAIRFIQPIIYQQASIKNPIGKSKAVDIYNHSLLAVGSLIGSMIFIISMIFHKQFFSILVAYEYQEYSYLLPWMVVSAVLFGISEILLLKMQSDMRTVKLSTVKCFLGLLGIILSVLGAAYGGLEGVTLALVLFCIVNLLIMAISSYA